MKVNFGVLGPSFLAEVEAERCNARASTESLFVLLHSWSRLRLFSDYGFRVWGLTELLRGGPQVRGHEISRLSYARKRYDGSVSCALNLVRATIMPKLPNLNNQTVTPNVRRKSSQEPEV